MRGDAAADGRQTSCVLPPSPPPFLLTDWTLGFKRRRVRIVKKTLQLTCSYLPHPEDERSYTSYFIGRYIE